jgi:hypothetical protein
VVLVEEVSSEGAEVSTLGQSRTISTRKLIDEFLCVLIRSTNEKGKSQCNISPFIGVVALLLLHCVRYLPADSVHHSLLQQLQLSVAAAAPDSALNGFSCAACPLVVYTCMRS